MITDKETNYVYFSSKLKEWYQPEYENIIKIIENYNQGKDDKQKIGHGLLHGTKDIWCRDYCPIQIDENNFVQFRYEPSYLKGYEDIKTLPYCIPELEKFNITPSEIIFDGGNVVKWSNKIIITDRIYCENYNKYGDKDLIKRFADELKLSEQEVIIIPADDTEMTGHADGMVRFIDEKKVFVNHEERLDDEDLKEFENDIKCILKKHKLEPLPIPVVYDETDYDDEEIESAIGCYVNFLQVSDLIIAPVFGYKEDRKVEQILKDNYKNCEIETIDINRIAEQGGLMNCLNWNVKIKK